MKIMVACEESQAVTKELRNLGHEAFYTNKISNAILIREILDKDSSNNIFSTNDYKAYLKFQQLFN